MSRPIITLTTDFGQSDSYVAEMKGVILSHVRDAQIVDITHEIAPQDIAHGAFVLARATKTFPQGTIHVAVIDPGVGTARDVIAVTVEQQHYILPDNGLISLVVEHHEPTCIVRIDSKTLPQQIISHTFHGRDIMAPAAAWLARGRSLRELGTQADRLKQFDFEPARCHANACVCTVIHIDHFGNVITNITGNKQPLLPDRTTVSMKAGQSHRQLIATTTYGAREAGEMVLLEGSHGYWEVAIVNGSANALLQLRTGDRIEFEWSSA